MMSNSYPKFHKSSLSVIASNYSLRCDAKQADLEILALIERVVCDDHFFLSDFLPAPFVKGIQPNHLDQPNDDSVPVVNTLSIQRLSLNESDCRHITREDFEKVGMERRLRKHDVLLTVDGGVSIGKPYLFDREGDFTIDSHVVILRPQGIAPLSLVYLLASPLGQAQFRKAESGASGQTTVTEDDVRRFVFPRRILSDIDDLCEAAEKKRQEILAERASLDEREKRIWQDIEIL